MKKITISTALWVIAIVGTASVAAFAGYALFHSVGRDQIGWLMVFSLSVALLIDFADIRPTWSGAALSVCWILVAIMCAIYYVGGGPVLRELLVWFVDTIKHLRVFADT